MTIARLPLSVAFWDYDRTMPLADSRVAIEGCAPSIHLLPPEAAFAKAFGTGEHDVSEISLANQIAAVSGGRSAYTAIPVFLSREFRLGALYVRTDRGIATPGDLAGRTVGLQEYGMTAAVVLRGILRDAYGLDTSTVHWRVGGVETAASPAPNAPRPAGFDIAPVPKGRSLDSMFADGDLDALVSIRVPPSVAAGHPKIARLFPNWKRAEMDYYRRTGIFPIMHAVGVRTTLLEANPWLAVSLYKAFTRAKGVALERLATPHAVALPWAAEALAEARALMGDDIWPYGIAANRRAIEAVLAWSKADGLHDAPLAVDDLFAPALLES